MDQLGQGVSAITLANAEAIIHHKGPRVNLRDFLFRAHICGVLLLMIGIILDCVIVMGS